LLYLGAWFKYQEYLPNKGKVLLLNHRMEKKKREKKVLPCIAKKKKKKKRGAWRNCQEIQTQEPPNK
jgi:hypothetical protein